MRTHLAATSTASLLLVAGVCLAGNPGGAAPPSVNTGTPPPPPPQAPVQVQGIVISPWEQIGGCAKRIGIFEPEHPFVIGCGNSDDTQIYRLTSARTFETRPGAGVSVIPTSDGYRVVTSDHKLWTSDGSRPPQIDQGQPCLQEYGRGGIWDWGLSCTAIPNTPDHSVWRRRDGQNRADTGLGFTRLPDPTFKPFSRGGAGVRIAVGLTDAVAWLVNSSHEIYRQEYCKEGRPDEEVSQRPGCSVPETWQRMPGNAIAIANGGKNQVWAIGTDLDKAGNGSVFQWNGRDWNRRAGSGKEIAVDPLGRPWVVGADGTIWRWRADVPAKGVLIPSDPDYHPPRKGNAQEMDPVERAR